MKRRIKIGITDCARYVNYEKWFLDAPESVDVIRLSYSLDNVDCVEQCDGIVLSGGEDVDPRRYKRPELLEKLNLVDIDEQRDEFELKVIDKAMKQKLPILGICRGMQLFNVYHGGTLVYDIPSVKNVAGHGKISGIDQRHGIIVEEETLLNQITGCTTGQINSSHHQCVDILANPLLIAAKADETEIINEESECPDNSIVEATQWKNVDDDQFFLGVQWHPERMPDQENPFSSRIRQAFLDHIKNKNDIDHTSTTTTEPAIPAAC